MSTTATREGHRQVGSFPSAPAELREWVGQRSRDAAVWIQRACVMLERWNEDLGVVPGAPIRARDESFGEGSLTRRDVHRLAAEALEDATGHGAKRLLWHALAWGANPRTDTAALVRTITRDSWVPLTLHEAARLATQDARAAFARLRPHDENAIAGLGPSDFTKYLYFAGGGVPNHPCLIVNRHVLDTLHRHTRLGEMRPRRDFGVETYMLALEVMTAWATELSTQERLVAPDEVERWAFATAGQ